MSQMDNNTEKDKVREQIASLLERDETRLGEAYKPKNENRTPPQIADSLGVATSGSVSNYQSVSSSMLDGEIPSSAAMSGQIVSRVRAWLRRPDLSSGARSYFDELQRRLQQRSENAVARTIEDEQA